jgi:hypothetical protein
VGRTYPLNVHAPMLPNNGGHSLEEEKLKVENRPGALIE